MHHLRRISDWESGRLGALVVEVNGEMHLEDLYGLLRSEHVQAQGIVDTLEEPLLVLDQAGRVLTGNRGFYETFRVARDETVGQSLFALGNGQWDIPAFRLLLDDIIPKAAAIVGYFLEFGWARNFSTREVSCVL